MTPLLARWGRWAGLAVALLITVPATLRPLQGHPLDGVNLVFHEAGHVLMSCTGETVMLLGGSLFQLLIPAACTAAFLLRRDRYSAGLLSLWLAQSLASVAAYIRDAPTRQLELISGDPDTHDWWQLLGGWNALSLADPLGRFVAVLAFTAIVAGVLLAVWDELR